MPQTDTHFPGRYPLPPSNRYFINSSRWQATYFSIVNRKTPIDYDFSKSTTTEIIIFILKQNFKIYQSFLIFSETNYVFQNCRCKKNSKLSQTQTDRY